MTIDDVLKTARRAWWLVVLFVLIGLLIGGARTLLTTPEYSSSTRLIVTTSSTDGASTALAGDQLSRARVTSYVELLTGERLAGRVIDALGLDMTPAELSDDVTARATADTVLIDLTVVATTAALARDIASSYAEEFPAVVADLETPEGSTQSTVTVTEVEAAELATSADRPDTARNLVLGVMLGLLLGSGAAVLRYRLDSTIRDADDAATAAGAGLLGALPEDPSLTTTDVLDRNQGFSSSAEAYRQIRTNLQFVDVDAPASCIVVTSAVPGEGKTTVAVNLALVIAQTGARVTLVEADLRSPHVTRSLGLVGGAGLTDVLAGTASLDEVTQHIGGGGLRVVAAGPKPANPSEVLGSRAMGSLVTQLRATNEVIIIDAPSLLPVTDGAVLARAADGAVLVVNHGVTTKQQLQDAAYRLRRIEARLLGLVLNRVSAQETEVSGYGSGYAPDEAGETGMIARVTDSSRSGRGRERHVRRAPARSARRSAVR